MDAFRVEVWRVQGEPAIRIICGCGWSVEFDSFYAAAILAVLLGHRCSHSGQKGLHEKPTAGWLYVEPPVEGSPEEPLQASHDWLYRRVMQMVDENSELRERVDVAENKVEVLKQIFDWESGPAGLRPEWPPEEPECPFHHGPHIFGYVGGSLLRCMCGAEKWQTSPPPEEPMEGK